MVTASEAAWANSEVVPAVAARAVAAATTSALPLFTLSAICWAAPSVLPAATSAWMPCALATARCRRWAGQQVIHGQANRAAAQGKGASCRCQQPGRFAAMPVGLSLIHI